MHEMPHLETSEDVVIPLGREPGWVYMLYMLVFATGARACARAKTCPVWLKLIIHRSGCGMHTMVFLGIREGL